MISIGGAGIADIERLGKSRGGVLGRVVSGWSVLVFEGKMWPRIDVSALAWSGSFAKGWICSDFGEWSYRPTHMVWKKVIFGAKDS